jgi:hypothetical protein
LFDPAKVENVIEFFDQQSPASPTGAVHHLYVNSYDIGETQQHKVLISYSGAHGNNQDIQVELGVSDQALADYNEFLVDEAVAAGDTLADGSPDMAHILQYELLPADFYTGPTTVTIPKGETKVYATYTVNTTLFDFAKAYVLPLRIVGSSTGVISGNYGVALFNIGAKNSYHGSYHSVGIRYNFNTTGDYAGWDDANDVATGNIASTGPWDFPATNVLTVNEFTSTIHVANSDGGFGTMNITVNPTTNVVTIAANGSTGVTNLVPLPGKVSTYDPVAKKFKLYYQYTNAAGTFRVMKHEATLN